MSPGAGCSKSPVLSLLASLYGEGPLPPRTWLLGLDGMETWQRS